MTAGPRQPTLDFHHILPGDDACAAWLIEIRWPDGFVGPA